VQRGFSAASVARIERQRNPGLRRLHDLSRIRFAPCGLQTSRRLGYARGIAWRTGAIVDVVITVLRYTPWWVWPLLILIIWLGIRGLRPYQTTPERVTFLPALFTGIALISLAQTAARPTAILVWLAGFVVGGLVGALWTYRLPVSVEKDRRLISVPGSAFWLAVGLVLFGARYAMGIYLGFHRAARQEVFWIVLPFAISGFGCGMSLSWWAVLMWRYRAAMKRAS
jgi:hypothetical protein